MPVRNIVYMIASPRPRVGKTFVARLLADYLLQNGRPVAGFDLNAPDAAFGAFLPAHVGAADIGDIKGQMALFDTLVADDGRVKIVDIGHAAFDDFFRIARDIGFAEEARRRGIAPVTLFIAAPDATSVESYAGLRSLHVHGALVPVQNELLGASHHRAKFPPGGLVGKPLHIPALAPALRRIAEQRPFSFADAEDLRRLSRDQQADLQQWLRRVHLEFREVELGLLLADVQSALTASP